MAAGGAGAPPNWAAQGPAPAPAQGNGCLKACLIVGVILVILAGIALAGLWYLGNQVVKSLPIDSEGNLQECTIISNQRLSSVLGSGTEAIPLEGIFDTLLGLVLDKRVLADATDCFISADRGSTGTGRIARYDGGDAAAKFAQEKQNAQPVSEDQGGGVTLSNEGYFAGDVSGIGDEAFCTGVLNATMSGVLVRQGDTLVYVSLLGSTQPDFETTESGVIWSPETCAEAQQVARAILGN